MNDGRRLLLGACSLARHLVWSVLLFGVVESDVAAPVGVRIEWDAATLTLVQPDGNYARIVRRGRELLCCFEWRGRCWVRRSGDEGKTWGEPVEAAAYDRGNAANPELLVLGDGVVLLFYNGRPRRGSGAAFTIEESVSGDGG